MSELTPGEMRVALKHAIDELHFAKNGASSSDFFTTVLVSYLAGAVTALAAMLLAVKLA